ncbi:MAG TPA: response regulator transcription factor [Oculatellaceae cyanobacterium]
MAKILVVEDDSHLSSLIRNLLVAERHIAETAANGTDALSMMKVFKYDLIVLDWMLPGMNGNAICQEYRNRGGAAPILMLTAKSSIEEKEAGLDSGADDYLTKPFDPRELLARIRALLRRPQAVSSSKDLAVGDLALDAKACKVFKAGNEVKLLPKEFNLLELFMRYPNQVFSPEALLERVWTADSAASFDTVRTYIKTLRKKIDNPDCASAIRTVHGVGYCLDQRETENSNPN